MTENAENFDFELVSPERKLMSEKAWQVTIPGYEGEFGVRAGHCSLVSNIRPGVVEIIHSQGEEPKKVFIAGGFADVTATNCTILAEQATMVREMDQETIEKELYEIQKLLDAADNEIDKARAEKELDLAKAKLTAVTGVFAD